MFKLQYGALYFAFGALLTFLLLRGCSQPEPPVTQYIKGKTVTDTIYRTDTIRIKQPKPYIVYAAPITDTAATHSLCDSVRHYAYSLDTAGLHLAVASQVQGVLLSQDVSYRLPTINSLRVDTVRTASTKSYRYAIGVLYDGQKPTIIGQYGVTRNVVVMGGWRDKGVLIGAGVRF